MTPELTLREHLSRAGRAGRGKCKARDSEKMSRAGKLGALKRWGPKKERPERKA